MTTAERDMFNAVAAEYDAVRPSYPVALFAELGEAVGGPGERVLEIGCGSGQATRGLVDRGWAVVAIDPAPDLIALAQAQLGGSADFHVARLEDFEPEPQAFRLVASAQAWHWVDPVVGFGKVRDALQPGGVFAIFGHVPTPSPALLARLEPIYAEIAPHLWGPPPEAWYLPRGPIRSMFDAAGLFGAVTHRGYAWSQRATGEAYVRQLGTRSYYNTLEPARRDRLLAEVETALRPLGEFPLGSETHLYWASLKA